MNKNVRTRFAPSPTGMVHIGGIYTAMFSYAYAKKNQGSFILRIEDTDRSRFVPGAEEAIIHGLTWANLIPDEGPHIGGEFGPYRQSERLSIYQEYAQQLIKTGKAYYAFETEQELEVMRKEQQELGEMPKYNRQALSLTDKEIQEKLAANIPHVIRLKIPDNREIQFSDQIRGDIVINSNSLDDQVLLKSDGYPTYHLAVVVDDHLMNISHVIRAEEWISSTPKHILLYEMLGWEPPIFAHMPIIRNADRSKISKRYDQGQLTWYIEEGFLPEAVLNYLATLGWSHPEEKDIFSTGEFIKLFDLKDMVTSAPVINLEKMTWLNGEYIRKLSKDALTNQLMTFNPDYQTVPREYLSRVVTLEQERAHTLKEFVERSTFFFQEKLTFTDELLVQRGKTKEETADMLKHAATQVEQVSNWSAEALEKKFDQFLSDNPSWSKKDLLMTIRGAVSAQTATPPLFDTLAVLGKDKCMHRLSSAIHYLSLS